jgi:hypothetical protein
MKCLCRTFLAIVMALLPLAHVWSFEARDFIYYGDYGGRFISESGKINRSLTLLKMRQRADFYPLFIVGGDSILVARAPQLANKPIYLFDQVSAELQNLRFNGLMNLSGWAFAQINYQINSDLILDAFVTLGNLNKSPLFLTLGKQYIPYGDFNKFEAEVNPLNKTLFRIDQPAVIGAIYYPELLFQTGFFTNDKTNTPSVMAAIEKQFNYQGANLRLNSGFVSNINNMTKPFTVLATSNKTLPAMDIFLIGTKRPIAMRLEWTQALRKVDSLGKIGAYNVDFSYQTILFDRVTKLSIAKSGLLNGKNVVRSLAFDQLSLFSKQYVASFKHRLNRRIGVGFSVILGKKKGYKTQAVADIVIKI